MSGETPKKPRAEQCHGTITKLWKGHRAVLWRRRCEAKTRHPSGYCINHRECHTSYRGTH